jgi:hypothetical protein
MSNFKWTGISTIIDNRYYIRIDKEKHGWFWEIEDRTDDSNHMSGSYYDTREESSEACMWEFFNVFMAREESK